MKILKFERSEDGKIVWFFNRRQSIVSQVNEPTKIAHLQARWGLHPGTSVYLAVEIAMDLETVKLLHKVQDFEGQRIDNDQA